MRLSLTVNYISIHGQFHLCWWNICNTNNAKRKSFMATKDNGQLVQGQLIALQAVVY